MKTREETIEMLKTAELEEGRQGLVDAFLATEPEVKDAVDKSEKKGKK
jgi:hypothetical protein